MASKSAQLSEHSHEEIEELLVAVEKTLDRVKVLYEQYFLGIQKQPPTHIHTDVERKLRELSQISIRNTALRYRFAMTQQKFGSYNSYWRRTLRQIEQGTYTRNLQKIGRQSARTGEDIPEEILAAMPKRMREQIRRDREAAVAIAGRRNPAQLAELELELADEDLELGGLELVDVAPATPAKLAPKVDKKTATGAHVLADDGDFDMDAFFAEVQTGTIPPPMQSIATRLTTQALPVPAARPVTPTQTPPAGTPIAAIRPVPAKAPIPHVVRAATPTTAPSQVTRPNPIAPGAAGRTAPIAVETMAGPFPREAAKAPPTPTGAMPPLARPGVPMPVRPGTQAMPATPRPPPPRPPPTGAMPPIARPQPAPARPAEAAPPKPQPAPAAGVPSRPPPGMSDADVTTLYAKYVQAKEQVGEQAGPGAYTKLLKTIHQQAPKIMEQYKARGVDFSVVVKDNQVIIRAKPKP